MDGVVDFPGVFCDLVQDALYFCKAGWAKVDSFFNVEGAGICYESFDLVSDEDDFMIWSIRQLFHTGIASVTGYFVTPPWIKLSGMSHCFSFCLCGE